MARAEPRTQMRLQRAAKRAVQLSRTGAFASNGSDQPSDGQPSAVPGIPEARIPASIALRSMARRSDHRVMRRTTRIRSHRAGHDISASPVVLQD